LIKAWCRFDTLFSPQYSLSDRQIPTHKLSSLSLGATDFISLFRAFYAHTPIRESRERRASDTSAKIAGAFKPEQEELNRPREREREEKSDVLHPNIMYAFYLNVKHVTKSLLAWLWVDSARCYWSQSFACSMSVCAEKALCAWLFSDVQRIKRTFCVHRFIKSSERESVERAHAALVVFASFHWRARALVKLFDLISSRVLSPKKLSSHRALSSKSSTLNAFSNGAGYTVHGEGTLKSLYIHDCSEIYRKRKHFTPNF
jgi:hypothetical protein